MTSTYLMVTSLQRSSVGKTTWSGEDKGNITQYKSSVWIHPTVCVTVDTTTKERWGKEWGPRRTMKRETQGLLSNKRKTIHEKPQINAGHQHIERGKLNWGATPLVGYQVHYKNTNHKHETTIQGNIRHANTKKENINWRATSLVGHLSGRLPLW